MEPKYTVGQKIRVRPVKNRSSSVRDAGIIQYAGQTGTVTDFYWIRPSTGEVFYIYTVRIGDSRQEITLHEDEVEAYKAGVLA
jgi:hypothetical protein